MELSLLERYIVGHYQQERALPAEPLPRMQPVLRERSPIRPVQRLRQLILLHHYQAPAMVHHLQ